MIWRHGARFHMLVKHVRDTVFLCLSHVLNELLSTSLSFKELNVLEGGRGDDWDRLGLADLMFK